MSVIDMNRDKT